MNDHDYLSTSRLDGQAFVVLGAGGGGIGTATSLALAAAGATLVCVDGNAREAQDIAAATGGLALDLDITDREQMTGLFRRVADEFGDRLGGIVDIVGVARNGPFESYDDVAVERQFAIVMRHALLAIQLGAPLLARSGGGTMTFVGSISGDRAVPNQAIYGTSKAALHQLVRYAAQEFGPQGVRANAVSPAFVATPRLRAAIPAPVWEAIATQNPMRRVAEPGDVARAILFLASPMSSYVNGQILTLDGGVTNDMVFPGLEIPLAGA